MRQGSSDTDSRDGNNRGASRDGSSGNGYCRSTSAAPRPPLRPYASEQKCCERADDDLHGPAVMTDGQKLEFMREWLMNVSRAMQDLRMDVEKFCRRRLRADLSAQDRGCLVEIPAINPWPSQPATTLQVPVLATELGILKTAKALGVVQGVLCNPAPVRGVGSSSRTR